MQPERNLVVRCFNHYQLHQPHLGICIGISSWFVLERPACCYNKHHPFITMRTTKSAPSVPRSCVATWFVSSVYNYARSCWQCVSQLWRPDRNRFLRVWFSIVFAFYCLIEIIIISTHTHNPAVDGQRWCVGPRPYIDSDSWAQRCRRKSSLSSSFHHYVG